MAQEYRSLLDAMIRHVKDRRNRGEVYAPITSAQWAAILESPPVRRRRSALAAPVVDTAASPPGSAVTAAAADLLPAEAGSPLADLLAKVRGASTVEQAAEILGRGAAGCARCPNLARTRRNVVLGVGDLHAELMFVGEAPGMEEDEQGEPFVGRAGQLLTRIIETMGFTRQTVYIANVLKCRPDTPGQATGNRKPTADEMRTCLPYLLSQIDLIRPRVLVALGATAVEGLLGQAVMITRFRGRFQDFRGIPLMPTYHPSYLLRNQSLAVKRQVWEDMLQVLEKLGRPISAKQRGYFLKSS